MTKRDVNLRSYDKKGVNLRSYDKKGINLRSQSNMVPEKVAHQSY